jgi:hypothetical protein
MPAQMGVTMADDVRKVMGYMRDEETYSIITKGPFSSSFVSLFIATVLCGLPASTDLICNLNRH